MCKKETINRYRSIITGTEILPKAAIPPKIMELFDLIDYEDLVRPFVIEERKKGRTYKEIAIKYEITSKQVIHIVKNVEPKKGNTLKKYTFN